MNKLLVALGSVCCDFCREQGVAKSQSQKLNTPNHAAIGITRAAVVKNSKRVKKSVSHVTDERWHSPLRWKTDWFLNTVRAVLLMTVLIAIDFFGLSERRFCNFANISAPPQGL